jgi:hypothetical protein
VDTLSTITLPDGEQIGLSEGTHIFDTHRDSAEVQEKVQAAQKLANSEFGDGIALLSDVTHNDKGDAEAQIYLANQKVFQSNRPYITIVIGTTFTPNFVGYGRDILQGAFLAQKECNEQHQGSDQTQVVLLIANVGEGYKATWQSRSSPKPLKIIAV